MKRCPECGREVEYEFVFSCRSCDRLRRWSLYLDSFLELWLGYFYIAVFLFAAIVSLVLAFVLGWWAYVSGLLVALCLGIAVPWFDQSPGARPFSRPRYKQGQRS